MKLLVIGARPRSLGAHVVSVAQSMSKFEVVTAGMHDNSKLDLTKPKDVHAFMKDVAPDHVVCTAGVNLFGSTIGEGWLAKLEGQMRTNYYGPMILLSEWARYWRYARQPETRHFVAVSSNSAHIARSNSVGYCASKAALSMAIRCTAREMAQLPLDEWVPLSIWCVEPGWLNDTPMSRSLETRFGHDALHRIPGGEGIPPLSVATHIVNTIKSGGLAFNGTTIRIDGGEQ